jgi:dethiobiotin synthetase
VSADFIITGTDTDVGKTVFAAALCGALGGYYWKPVQAGLTEETDSESVATLSGLPGHHILPEAYRLTTPCSPHRAAAIDGVEIDRALLTLPRPGGPLIVEGAGGALVPLNKDWLSADQFALWQLPVIIVARTALGTINHSLLTIEALRSRAVPIHSIAFIGDPHQDSEVVIPAISGVRRLGRLPQLPVLDAATLRAAFAANFDMGDFR